jgi:DNA adenine methylase
MSKNLAAIRWFGGKQRMVTKIVPLLQIIPHNFYIESFGGGGAILLNKFPSIAELYNDIDSGLVNFFRVLRDPDKFKLFYILCSLTPFSREEYETACANWETYENDVERAHAWFVVARQSFGGHFGHSWSVSKTVNNKGHLDVQTWFNSIVGLQEISKRLLNVQIENKDYTYIFEHYDTPNSLFFCDPPYVPSLRSNTKYKNELTEEDHKKLLDLLLQLKGRVVLCGYPNDLYDGTLLEKGWKTIKFTAKAVAFSNVNKLVKGEKMADNYNATECLWIDPLSSKELMI